MATIRTPAVAGQFYESDQHALLESIRSCFTDERGPQSIPEIKEGKQNPRGIVVPHAGYPASGSIAAHAYHYLASNGFADTFIILGPNHTGMGSGVSIMTEGGWKTPLGIVPINESTATKLQKDIIDNDEVAHIYEHSIEVQLPFLQFLANGKSFDFVPICMGMQDVQTSQEVGGIIADVIKKSEQRICIVASSDFSHAGFNYQSMPPTGTRVNTYCEQQDKLAIEKILEMEVEGLIYTVHKHHITMCGYGPVAAMIVAAKKLGATTAELLKYGSSYEVYPGGSCVGYGAIAVY
ncbi:MAG: MEMO1 family protein [Candidatus Thermoplasmatota archaeon]|nr:MEMO1 family protein [Candidatus Thermoplasmatota archaeon]